MLMPPGPLSNDVRPEVYWIDLPADARLAVMPRPHEGDRLDGDIAGWRAEGIDVVVSLLEAGEAECLGLQREESLCRGLAMEFMSFPIPDGRAPAVKSEAVAIAETIITQLNEGKAVAVHCHAGIGRAPLMAACVLMLLGMPSQAACDLIGKARGRKVPHTEEQQEWVRAFRETTTGAPGPSETPL